MDQLMEFLITIGDIARLRTQLELRRLRDSVIIGIVVAVCSILPGAFFGAISLDFKMAWIGIGMLIAAIAAISLAYYRTPAGLTLAAAIDKVVADKPGLVTAVTGGGGRYVRFVGGFLSSQLGAGLIVFWLPGHQYFVATLFLIPAMMVIITYVIWKGGGDLWPRLVWRLAIATLVVVVGMILFPRLSHIVLAKAGKIEDKIICVIDDTRLECQKSFPAARVVLPPTVFSCPAGKFADTAVLKRGEERFFNTPIAGNLLVGLQGGGYILGRELDGSETPKLVPSGLSSWNLPSGGMTKFRAAEDNTKICVAYPS